MKTYINLSLLFLLTIALYYVEIIYLIPVYLYFITFSIYECFNYFKTLPIKQKIDTKEILIRYGYKPNGTTSFLLKKYDDFNIIIRLYEDNDIYFVIYNEEIDIPITNYFLKHNKPYFSVEKMVDFIEDETTGYIDHNNMKDFFMYVENGEKIYVKILHDFSLYLKPNGKYYDLYFMLKHKNDRILISKGIYNDKLNKVLSFI